MDIARRLTEKYHLAAAAGVLLFFAVQRYLALRARARAIGPDLPGFRLLIGLPIPMPVQRLTGVIATGRWFWQQHFQRASNGPARRHTDPAAQRTRTPGRICTPSYALLRRTPASSWVAAFRDTPSRPFAPG